MVNPFAPFGFLLSIIFSILYSGALFPFPLSDVSKTRYRSLPWMVMAIIIINMVFFLVVQAYGIYAFERLENRIFAAVFSGDIESEDEFKSLLRQEFDSFYGSIETNYTYGYRAYNAQNHLGIAAFTVFTSMFMHGDHMHLIGNMIFLWTFGRRLEDACGPWRFLLFYLLAGVLAQLPSGLLEGGASNSAVPSIGASGAIFGVMMAYLFLYPNKWIMCIWGIGLIFRLPYVLFKGNKQEWPWWIVPIPSWMLLFAYIGINLLSVQEQVDRGASVGGVAVLAHLAGAAAAVFIYMFVRKDLLSRMLSGRPI
jgi:membrane associated rhomboid family serine protease